MIEVRWYRPGATGAEVVEPEALAECIARREGLVWVDLTHPHPESVAMLVADLGVHELAAEDLAHAGQRVKLDRYEDHFHLAAYEVDLDDGEMRAREIDFLVADGWLVTARRPDDRDSAGSLVTEARRRFERTLHLGRAVDEGHLLHALLDALVDEYLDHAEELRAILDRFETAIFEGRDETEDGRRVRSGDEVQRAAFELRRTLVSFMRLVAPLGDALAAMVRGEIGGFKPEAAVHLQDVHDHVIRVSEDLQDQRELLDGALQAHLAMASNRMNEVMERITAWGAILVINTLIAGIYGMNFRHMPELDWRFGYPLVLGLMVAVAVVLHRRFRRRGWL
ncbi:MAG TPA: CorA family divalent cation transporter [Acidimicrobiia bacterium]|nr:CorA family divalent cation transporter [Acidimicrobiia bacterium]